MNMKRAILLIISSFLCISAPLANAGDAATYQMDTILEGDMANAEKELVTVLNQNPDDPYAMLNLAFIYQKSGYSDKARDLYKRILSLPDNPMAELASGKPERIKHIARRGLTTVAQ